MARPERQMYADHVQPVLAKAKRDPVRVENPVYPGTPDVNYVDGWVELKCLLTVPKRGGVVSIPHYTPQQRAWLIKRWRANGNAFLLLRLGKYWMLFDGETAARDVGHVDVLALRQSAIGFSETGFDPGVFLPLLDRWA